MPKMVYDPVHKLSYDRACNGCVYRGRVGSYGCCDYIFIKDKPRPCPPGKDCTVKETGRKKRRTEDGKKKV